MIFKTHLSGELEPLTDIEASDNGNTSADSTPDENDSDTTMDTGSVYEDEIEYMTDESVSGASNSSFPQKLRNASCGSQTKLSRLTEKVRRADEEFGRFRFEKAKDWSIDDAAISNTSFLGDGNNAGNLPETGSSPAEHLENLRKSGYKKITLGYVLPPLYLN
jgi:hypothetical protein